MPENPVTWDRYAYGKNNPVKYNDPSGHWVETALDIAFIAYDIYEIKANDLTWSSGLSLAADVVGAALPIATGLGLGVRTLFKAGEAADKVADTVRVLDKADDVADVISHSDDLVDVERLANSLPDDALVCRGGLCDASSFKTVGPDGKLRDISVQSAPGKTVEDLSVRLPNNQVGVTTVGNVRAAGGNVVPSPRPGNPYHADLSGITPDQAQNLFQPTWPNPIPREERLLPW